MKPAAPLTPLPAIFHPLSSIIRFFILHSAFCISSFSILTPSGPRSRHPNRNHRSFAAAFSIFHPPSSILRFSILHSAFCISSFSILAATLCACSGPRPLRGGKAITSHTPTGAIEQTLAQSDNPSAPSRQDQETIRTRTYTLPAGTLVEPREQPSTFNLQPSTARPTPPDPSSFSLHPSSFQLSAPVVITEREETRARTELGAAQKDTARELGAKLSSLKGIVWVGLGLFVFGLASIFWLPLRTIIGSVTTSIAIALGGLALMILPTLIVGNELLILGGVALAVGAWFLAHRHGHLRGQLKAALEPESKPSSTK